VTLSLVISGVLVLAMIGISLYAARYLPPDVRIPIHYGLGAYNNFVSRNLGLVMWPAVGVLIFGIFAGVEAAALKPNHGGGGVAPVLVPIALAVVLFAQVGAIRTGQASGTGQSGE
jgi:hypothetical protein